MWQTKLQSLKMQWFKCNILHCLYAWCWFLCNRAASSNNRKWAKYAHVMKFHLIKDVIFYFVNDEICQNWFNILVHILVFWIGCVQLIEKMWLNWSCFEWQEERYATEWNLIHKVKWLLAVFHLVTVAWIASSLHVSPSCSLSYSVSMCSHSTFAHIENSR